MIYFLIFYFSLLFSFFFLLLQQKISVQWLILFTGNSFQFMSILLLWYLTQNKNINYSDCKQHILTIKKTFNALYE